MAEAFSESTYVGDAFRVACAVVGLVVLALVVRRALVVRNTRQYALWALAVFSIAAIGTEVERIGDVVTWRLPTNVAGVVLALIYLIKMRAHQRAGEDIT